jgi:hypothetical protein
MVKRQAAGESSALWLSRKECLKAQMDDAQPFENTSLYSTTFPKKHFLGKVASVVHSGTVASLP